MQPLSGFDPLIFLGIKIEDEQERVKQRYLLLEQISQYLFIRFAEEIPTEKLMNFENYQDLLRFTSKNIPDIKSKLKNYLEDFKKEFKQNG